MLPGKKYSPEDVLAILWRSKWLLLVPFAVISAGTAVWSRYLPDRFLSEATIMVVPQRVPESYVRSTVTTKIEDRLRAITEQIMSRTRLERVILELELYAEERRTGIMQDIVEKMRTEVTVRPGQGETFRVGFMADTPVVARKVAEKITSLFIDESLRQRENLAEGTNQFLEAQLETARANLAEHEKRLEAFRMQYSAELPEQREANLQAASSSQLEIQQLNEALSRNQERRIGFERALAELESEGFIAAVSAVAPVDPKAMTAAQQLAAARSQLEAMLKVRTSEHPDIVSMRMVIAELEKRAEDEALRTPLSEPDAGLPVAERARRKRVAELRADLEQLDRQIAAQTEEGKRLRAVAAEYQRRAEMAPRRESEMIELTRDYGILTKQYNDLLGKRGDAQISANLERRQIGEQFEVLDPARLPERPVSPNRQRINLMGMAAAFAVGLGLVALVEYRDRSFKTDDEVKALLSLPVLAVVPMMRSDVEKRRQWRRSVFTHMFFGSVTLACLAVVAYTFIR